MKVEKGRQRGGEKKEDRDKDREYFVFLKSIV